MKLTHVSLTLSVFLFSILPVLGAEYRSGAGVGINAGSVDADIFSEELDFDGYTLFYKFGFTDTWGLLVSYRDMEDDEDLFLGEKDEYTQFAIHAVYMWRAGNKVRPHIKFGLAHTDFEATVPGFFSDSDSDVTLSLGGGLEVGSEKLPSLVILIIRNPKSSLWA